MQKAHTHIQECPHFVQKGTLNMCSQAVEWKICERKSEVDNMYLSIVEQVGKGWATKVVTSLREADKEIMQETNNEIGILESEHSERLGMIEIPVKLVGKEGRSNSKVEEGPNHDMESVRKCQLQLQTAKTF